MVFPAHDLAPAPDYLRSWATEDQEQEARAFLLRSEEEPLQPERMSSFEAKRHALGRLPARRPAARGIVRRSSIQAQAGDHGEGVTVSSIDRDPFPASAISEGAQFCRTQRRAHQPGAR